MAIDSVEWSATRGFRDGRAAAFSNLRRDTFLRVTRRFALNVGVELDVTAWAEAFKEGLAFARAEVTL